jgi:beta-glucosidase
MTSRRDGWARAWARARPHRRSTALLIGVAALAGLAVSSRADTPPDAIEARIDALLAKMTLAEKLGQLQQLDGEADGNYRPEHLDLARRGLLGSTLNVRGARRVNELQRAAVEQSRLSIPLLFAFDVIHGYRTIFPIPFGEAASWDPAAVERSAAIAAAEARAAGIAWTFAPMVDIARDARWGRIAEGAGEDPYLGAVIARARVRGFQGDDYSRPDKVVACAKHWVAYGAAEAGRDYNSVDVSERTLRSVYFPPFKAAVDAGVGTFMSAFNDINGVPASANPFTLTDVLRKEWRFDGLVVSDYTSVAELINHGIARDDSEAAWRALGAGVDMEMVSRTYAKGGSSLVESGRLPMSAVDEAVRRVLRVKLRAGLFERPYADETREVQTLFTGAHRQAAREIAARSMVLLKNEQDVLPFATTVREIAVIGALADDRESTLGSWIGDGRVKDTATVLDGIRAAVPDATVRHAKGAAVTVDPSQQSDRAGIEEAVRLARDAHIVILVVGETGAMSGEAASRASLDLPGQQLELIQQVLAAGKPTAIVLMNGRPLAIPWLAENASAILEAWLPGTEGGHAVADVLFGKVNPGGKLPATFPRTVGQVPIHYDALPTGRPASAANRYTSKYLDVPWTPLFPFGHGLSYTRFELRDLRMSAPSIDAKGSIDVSVEVVNIGRRLGDEIVQLYVQDVVGSVSRPVQQLRGFERLTLQPGQARRVSFRLGPADLGFYDERMRWVVEPGEFRVRMATSSVGGLTGSFEVR